MRKSPIRPETKNRVTVEKKSVLKTAEINRLTANFARTVAISKMETKQLMLRLIVFYSSPQSGAVLAAPRKIRGKIKINPTVIKTETPK